MLRETEGKTLTEIGSRNGDILACITHFKVNEEKLPAPVSVELDREYCDKMRARGIEVRCDPIEASARTPTNQRRLLLVADGGEDPEHGLVETHRRCFTEEGRRERQVGDHSVRPAVGRGQG